MLLPQNKYFFDSIQLRRIRVSGGIAGGRIEIDPIVIASARNNETGALETKTIGEWTGYPDQTIRYDDIMDFPNNAIRSTTAWHVILAAVSTGRHGIELVLDIGVNGLISDAQIRSAN